MMKEEYKENNCNILVSNNHLVNLAGSEINTLQICNALNKQGHLADAATFYFDDPIKEKFTENNITVHNLLKKDLDFSKYNIIWAHHLSTINQIIFNSKLGNPKVIFSSLSPYEPLEAPPFFYNELNNILSISEENKKELVSYGIIEKKIINFPNYAPHEFFNNCRKYYNSSPRKFAVISNHPPEEVRGLSKLIENDGYQIDFYGINDQVVFVNDELIKRYDLVISIGKTVQYCFALKVPIYCYDHFGGPGYLNRTNFNLADYYNFSGRGFNRKLSETELYNDIQKNYHNAVSNSDWLYKIALQNYVLEDNINKVINLILSEQSIDIGFIRDNFTLAHRHHILIERLINQSMNKEFLKNQLIDKEQAIQSLNAQLAESRNEVLYYALSKSWRITRPLRKIMNLFRGKKE